MKKRLRIFLGSAGEDLLTLARIAGWIRSLGYQPVSWNEIRAFPASEFILPTLIRHANECDAAVFIFSGVDKVVSGGKQFKQARDNVLIEYGIFAGKLGSKRVAICRLGSSKESSDLKGLVYINLGRSGAKQILSHWLQAVQKDIQKSLSHKRYSVKQSIEFYDRIAGDIYDGRLSSAYRMTHRFVAERIHRQIIGEQKPLVLDVGGGTGKLLDILGPIPQVEWTYIDASPRMLNYFSREFDQQWVNAEVCHGKFEDVYRSLTKQYDVILMSFFLSSCTSFPKFSKLAKILKPTGILIVVEAEPEYSKLNPFFSVTVQKVEHALRIRTISREALRKNLEDNGWYQKELSKSIFRENDCYSYVSIFTKS